MRLVCFWKRFSKSCSGFGVFFWFVAGGFRHAFFRLLGLEKTAAV
nr:MAG TPA: hypothetical protein [Caudoviricetes sp.]